MDRRVQLSDRDKGERRFGSLGLFKEYLSGDGGRAVLDQLGYTQSQQEYVLNVVGFLTLSPTPVAKGLQARPSQVSENSPASLVESPAVGVAEFTATLPGNLRWVAAGRMSDAEIEEFVKMGALMRLVAVDPENIDTTDPKKADKGLVKALYVEEALPRFGLWEEGIVANLLRGARQATVYRAGYLDSDFKVEWHEPRAQRKAEIWRPMNEDANGMKVYGKVPHNS